MGKALGRKKFIEQRIFLIRGRRVILGQHLAELYDVEARALVQAYKRNVERFPRDFAFLLTNKEVTILKSQTVISRWGGSRRVNFYVFTEQGVAMLSSVLRSKRAIQVNIAIMRTFVRLREVLSANKELVLKLSQLENRIEKHDEDICAIFEAIRQLMEPPPKKPKRQIGFHEE
ncbi:MAG: ORF6N domain-containing protein [Candidatus Tantalella remota]|nr:ORF6N domain-containing protein [Candidatus Tantalella remota]